MPVQVPASMASGMAVASLANSAAAAGTAATTAPLTWPGDDMANAGALLVAVAVLAMLGLASVGQQVRMQEREYYCLFIVPCLISAQNRRL